MVDKRTKQAINIFYKWIIYYLGSSQPQLHRFRGISIASCSDEKYVESFEGVSRWIAGEELEIIIYRQWLKTIDIGRVSLTELYGDLECCISLGCIPDLHLQLLPLLFHTIVI